MREEDIEEARWLVVKSWLDEFPKLRERVKRYLLGEKDWEKLLKSHT